MVENDEVRLGEYVNRFVTYSPERPFNYPEFDEKTNSLIECVLREGLHIFAEDVWASLPEEYKTGPVKTVLFYKVYKRKL